MEIISWALNRELSSLSIRHTVPSSTHLQSGTEGGLSFGQCPPPQSTHWESRKGGRLAEHPPARNPACAPGPFGSPQVLALQKDLPWPDSGNSVTWSYSGGN
ncbi:uncharacterized protein LOC72240 isoform X1 [Mus musculus]|uniref:RIKEN cDNA 1600014C23 gene n=1 Tax=Mus musculus TaxID=10090 RepID=Q9DAX4_MOUSE|nr:uncharacterized protein LOC72240 [Mus musculus]XP_006525031.1 uncharacterized protein LOC72240 isoform X1 [Mus musculus]BAB24043.1 unnamed protein product [Mus musculus]|eukprot:NP_082440.1 uncharacterized protein LOC72240 [Mus musculus]